MKCHFALKSEPIYVQYLNATLDKNEFKFSVQHVGTNRQKQDITLFIVNTCFTTKSKVICSLDI